jgi:V8-like Glu-specific endopeptidase
MSHYKQVLALLICALVCVNAGAQRTARAQQQIDRTSKAIYATYKAAIVQIYADSQPKGTGFFISANGVILTANHVVAKPPKPPDPANRPEAPAYLPNLKVKLIDGTMVDATPVLDAPSDDSKAHDYAILKTDRIKTAYLKLGSSTEIGEGDALSTIGYPFSPPTPWLLTVTMAGRYPSDQGNVVAFQGPANRGLSGAPVIDNRTGNVIGIVSTKIAGITPNLAAARDVVNASQARIVIAGVDPNAAIRDLTDVLDQFLISGMGVAVAIEYAKTSAASVLPK